MSIKVIIPELNRLWERMMQDKDVVIRCDLE